MAEGLLTHSTGSRKKSKQKTFDVFHQSPISGSNISRAVPCVGPIDFAPPGCRKNRVSDGQNVTSDSDSSTKSGTGSSPFTPSSPTVCVNSQGVSQSTPIVPYSKNDPGAKHRKENSPGANTFVTASVRQPIVSIDRNPPALGKHPQSVVSTQSHAGTLNHVTNNANFSFQTDASTLYDNSAAAIQLRKLCDHSVVSVPQVMVAKSIEMGTTRSAFSPVLGGANMVPQDMAASDSRKSTGTAGPPRLPPRVPLQQKPFGKQHKRNSANCSVTGSNASINSCPANAPAAHVSSTNSSQSQLQVQPSSDKSSRAMVGKNLGGAFTASATELGITSRNSKLAKEASEPIASSPQTHALASSTSCVGIIAQSGNISQKEGTGHVKENLAHTSGYSEDRTSRVGGNTPKLKNPSPPSFEQSLDDIVDKICNADSQDKRGSSSPVVKLTSPLQVSSASITSAHLSKTSADKTNSSSIISSSPQHQQLHPAPPNISNFINQTPVPVPSNQTYLNNAASSPFYTPGMQKGTDTISVSAMALDNHGASANATKPSVLGTPGSQALTPVAASQTPVGVGTSFVPQRTGSTHRTGQIWELLEGGKLSHGTSTLFRSLPILRSGPSPQNIRNKLTTQSLNRSHFQTGNGAEEYNKGMKGKPSLPDDQANCDSYHLNSRVLQDKIIALDRQRAHLLAKIEREAQRLKYYSEKFFNLKVKMSNASEEELQCLQSDEIVLVCKLEEEFGFKSEQQLKESVDFQTEQLSKMDEKLIQLFEVLYILETAEANFEDELHLAASEGAVLTKSRVLTTDVRISGTSGGLSAVEENQSETSDSHASFQNAPGCHLLSEKTRESACSAKVYPNVTAKVFTESCSQSPVNVERSAIAGSQTSGYSSHISGVPKNLGNANMKTNFSSPVNSGASPEFGAVENANLPKHKPAPSSYQPVGMTPQIEMMYQFLAFFNNKNYEEMSKTFLLMSSTPESCSAMRQSGCLPLIIQLIHCDLDSALTSSANDSSSGGKEVANSSIDGIDSISNNLESTSLSATSAYTSVIGKESWTTSSNPGASSGVSGRTATNSTGTDTGMTASGGVGTSDEDLDMFHITVALKAMSDLNKNCDNVRQRSIESLHNIIHSQTDSPQTNREIKVLSYLAHIRSYSENICEQYNELLALDKDYLTQKQKRGGAGVAAELEKHILLNASAQTKLLEPVVSLIYTLVKLSFNPEELTSFQTLGGIAAVCELMLVDIGREFISMKYSSTTGDQHQSFSMNSSGNSSLAALSHLSTKLRRHIAELLTNVTHKNQAAKSTLTHYPKVMRVFSAQLRSDHEDLVHVTSDLFRNLAWQPERSQKMLLREMNVVLLLSEALLKFNNMMTLRAVLSALWNLSNHCTENKVEICSVEGCLEKVISLMKQDISASYNANSATNVTCQIAVNASGLLSHLCSHIATRAELRQILRSWNTCNTLLEFAKCPNLTLVANACSCLFYLSARDRTDQEVLWQLGAPSILKDLAKESNPKIASAAHGAFKNLMQAKKQLKMNPSGNSSLSFCPGTGSDDNGAPSPIMNGGGVAQLVRPAVMIDYNGPLGVDDVEMNDQKRFIDGPVVDPGSEFRKYANLSGPGATGGASSGFEQGVDLSYSGAQASKDMTWNEESYSDDRNNRVSSSSPQQQQTKTSPSLIPKQNRFNSRGNQGKVLHASRQAALMHRDDDMEFSNRKFVSPARRGSPSTSLTTGPKGQGQADPKPTHNLQMVPSCRGAGLDNYNDDLSSSQINSAAADEVVNYTLKYANNESQYDNFDGPAHGGMSSYTDCYPHSGGQGENEEPEYYEQPTDFSARFQENDAMSTYEELNYSSYSKNGAVDVTLVNDVSLSTIGNQSSGFGDPMYHDVNEHTDRLSDTVPSQSGAVSNSPAGVFRQVRFNSSVKETVNDIQVGHGLSSTALLESERQVASGSHKNNFQASVRRSHMSSVSSTTNSHFEPDDSGKKESASGTPLMGETPLMFSRRSSVSSLSDFETQSINSNSNFTSEQGSRAISGAVSPSDIPDSPNEAMLTERMAHDTENIQDPNFRSQVPNMQQNNINREMRNMDMAEYDIEAESDDKPRVFATETTPHEYSCASSLSALSFDDQPKVKKGNKQNPAFVGTRMSAGAQGQLQLPPRLNLTATNAIVQELSAGKSGNNLQLQQMGDQETGGAGDDSELGYGADETVDFANVTGINESDDDSLLNDDDNLQGNLYNEEDHSVLMEAISSGMPEKKVKSSSKRQHNASSESINSNAIKGSSAKTGSSAGSYSASYKDRRSPGLTRSNSGRNLATSGRKSPGPSKANAGGNFSGGASSNNPRTQHSYLGIYLRRSSQTESTISSPRSTGVHMDSVKTYHTEGTPLNFSTATSLSDLSVAAEETGNHTSQIPSYQPQAQQQTYANISNNQTQQQTYANINSNQPQQQTYANINSKQAAMNPKEKTRLKSWNIHSPGGGSVSKYSNNTGFDSPRVYNVEGTPASFSRNDSLSSLSCDEGMDDNPLCSFMEKNAMPFIPEGGNMTVGSNEGVLGQSSSNMTAAQSRVPAPIAPVVGSKIPLSKSTYRPSSRGAESRSGNSSPAMESRKSQNLSNGSSKSNVNEENGNVSSPGFPRSMSNSQSHHKNQLIETYAPKDVSRDDERSGMRERSLSEISNGSSGSGDDVGMEDKALLDECIYSAMPSSARKQQKHKPVNKLPSEMCNEGGAEYSADPSVKRKINYSIINENDNSSTVLND